MNGLGIGLGARIKELRQGKGLSQAAFAGMLGVTKSTVSSYENGSRLPSYDILIAIARLFRVSIDHLLGCSAAHTLDVTGLTPRQVGTLQDIADAYRECNKTHPQ